MSGSPLRWPTKQVCIKCPFTQDLSSSPTGLYLTIILRGRAGYRMIDNQRGA